MGIIDKIISFFFPDRCPYCNKTIKANEYACTKCKNDFPDIHLRIYAKGGNPCYSPFLYRDKFSSAIKRFKFNNYPQYSKKLAIPLANTIHKNIEDINFDYITYVPMHKTKLRNRGYNQAQLLAKDTSKLLNIPLADLLTKPKENQEQHNCPYNKKKVNVRGVYKAINKDKIKGKNILIIDDVITSGYTLGECCKVLYKNGANNVCCATVCCTNIM